jgi:hypothetical protein
LQPCFRGWYVRANISRRCFAPRAPQTALHCTAQSRRLAARATRSSRHFSRRAWQGCAACACGSTLLRAVCFEWTCCADKFEKHTKLCSRQNGPKAATPRKDRPAAKHAEAPIECRADVGGLNDDDDCLFEPVQPRPLAQSERAVIEQRDVSANDASCVRRLVDENQRLRALLQLERAPSALPLEVAEADATDGAAPHAPATDVRKVGTRSPPFRAVAFTVQSEPFKKAPSGLEVEAEA